MLTYFKGRYGRYGPPDGQGYTENEYFTHRLDAEHILLTTRHRAWVILDPQEYELFLLPRFPEANSLSPAIFERSVLLAKRKVLVHLAVDLVRRGPAAGLL